MEARGVVLENDGWLELMRRPIAFHPAFSRISGSVKAGIFLSQAFYWDQRTSDPDGWFFKTQAEWEEETTLNRREQETARQHLQAKGFLEECLRDMPARLYYRIKIDAIKQALNGLSSSMAESAKQERQKVPNMFVRKVPNKSVQKCQTFKAETTTETTSEDLNPSVSSNEETSPRTEKPSPRQWTREATTVLDYLNHVSGSAYQSPSRETIVPRLKDGATVEQCLLVIDWFRAVKMPGWDEGYHYFRPKTLFSRTNFGEYLGKALPWHEKGRPSLNHNGKPKMNPDELLAYLHQKQHERDQKEMV